MKGKMFAFCLVLMLVSSCNDDISPENDLYSDLLIQTGTVCGWCSVNDAI